MYKDKNFFLCLIPENLTPMEVENLNDALMERGYILDTERIEELESKIEKARKALED